MPIIRFAPIVKIETKTYFIEPTSVVGNSMQYWEGLMLFFLWILIILIDSEVVLISLTRVISVGWGANPNNFHIGGTLLGFAPQPTGD